MTQVGKRLREFRKSLRMTQEELALGICNRSYVSQIEKGQVIPSPEILEQLAKRLQKDLKEFWLEAPNPSFTQVEIQNALKHVINRIDENEWEMARKWINKLHEIPLSELDEAKYLWSKAQIAEYDGTLDFVEELYLKSLQIARKLQDSFCLIRSLDSLGNYYTMQHKAHKAVPYLYEAYQYLHQFDLTGTIRVSVLYHLGLAHLQLEEYYAATEHLRKANQMNMSIGTLYKSSEINMQLGHCYMATEQYQEALFHLNQARTLYSLFPHPVSQVELYTALGSLHEKMGDLITAKSFYIQALGLRESEDREASQDQPFKLALVRYLLLEGLEQEALEYLEENKTILPPEANLLIAQIYQRRGQVEQAYEILKQTHSPKRLTGSSKIHTTFIPVT